MELQYLAEVSRNEAIVLGRRLSPDFNSGLTVGDQSAKILCDFWLGATSRRACRPRRARDRPQRIHLTRHAHTAASACDRLARGLAQLHAAAVSADRARPLHVAGAQGGRDHLFGRRSARRHVRTGPRQFCAVHRARGTRPVCRAFRQARRMVRRGRRLHRTAPADRPRGHARIRNSCISPWPQSARLSRRIPAPGDFSASRPSPTTMSPLAGPTIF